MLRRSSKMITTLLFMSGFLGVLDAGAVAPALTAIIQEWSIPYKWGIWTITVYVLMFVVSTPVMKHLSRRLGRQLTLSISLALFGAGATLSGFSPHFSVLIVGRFIQGIGGGGLMTSVSVIFDRRGMVRQPGVVGILFAVGAILAFLLGSLFVTVFHWRWMFYLQLLIAFLGSILIFHKPVQHAERREPLDVVGILLLTCISLCLMIGLTSIKLEQFWTSFVGPEVFPFIVIALGLFIPFIMVERQQAAPIIPLPHVLRRETMLVNLSGAFTGISWIALLFIPAFAENLLRLETGVGGYLLVVVAVMATLSLMFVEWMDNRIHSRLTMTIGLFIVSCSYLLLGTAVNQLWTLLLSASMLGLGLGMTVRLSSKPMSVIHYFHMIGAAIGAAVLVTFLTQATDKIPERVKDSLVVTSPSVEKVSGGIFSDLVAGSAQFMVPNAERLKEFIPDNIAASTQELILRQIMNIMRETLTEGYHDVFLAAAIFSLISFMCLMILFRLEQDEGQS